MQAIETYFLCPTNFRGPRIVARCDAGRIVLPWDHALSPGGNHAAAARARRAKLGWQDRELVGGTLIDGRSVWVRPCEWQRIAPDPLESR